MSSTDRQTDRRTDGQGESSIPPSNFVGRGYNDDQLWGALVTCSALSHYLNQWWPVVRCSRHLFSTKPLPEPMMTSWEVLVTCSTLSHYLNHDDLGSTAPPWTNFHDKWINPITSIKKKSFKNVCKISAILSGLQCTNHGYEKSNLKTSFVYWVKYLIIVWCRPMVNHTSHEIYMVSFM